MSEMKPLSWQAFNEVYQASVRRVLEHWTTQMQWEIASHCRGWSPDRFDFRDYLEASSVRFYRAYRAFTKAGDPPSICDVGGFWGVFPVTLRELGYDVTMTESLQYYGGSFNPLFDYIRERGVTILDYDPFQPEARLIARFDVVTVMAVLEHYPHSLKPFMENVVSLLPPGGRLYLEVPNIAYWPKRIELLRGQTPQTPLADIFHSETPFIGHHHEFTLAELRELVASSGLSVISEDTYNYTPGSLPALKRVLRSPLQFLAFSLLKDSRECLAILCRREVTEHSQMNRPS
ncbi:MAG: class I SAM-dependent methyltransferase [Acidobacteria bacterium]|nr:class I SAM-dependent methyltransferase [Acidobacteriota bacterium]